MVKLGGVDARGGVGVGHCPGPEFVRSVGRQGNNRFGGRSRAGFARGPWGTAGTGGSGVALLSSVSSDLRSDSECGRLRGGCGNVCGWQGPGHRTEFGTAGW